MEAAIKGRRLNINDLIPRDAPVRCRLNVTLFNSREILLRDRTTLNRGFEFNATAPLEWRQPQPHMAILPTPAALLNIPPFYFNFLANSLTIRHLRLTQRYL